jgi:hypothetical protein
MYESLIRPHEVSAVTPLLSVTDAAARLKSQEARREQKRLHQITASRARVQGKSADGDGKRKRDELEAEDAEDGEQESVDMVEAKKPKIEAGVADAQPSGSGIPVRASEQTSTANNKGKGRWKPIPVGEPRFVVSKAFPEVRGHTSYLTFALLVPLPATTRSLDMDSAQPSAGIASVETPVISVADVDVMNSHISGLSFRPTAATARFTYEKTKQMILVIHQFDYCYMYPHYMATLIRQNLQQPVGMPPPSRPPPPTAQPFFASVA